MAESKLDIVLNPKGFDNIEKAVRGVRTEFSLLDKQVVVGGKDIGSLADAFHGMGLQIPVNPMMLLGEVTGKVIQFTQQAVSETMDYNIAMSKLAKNLGIGVEETSRMIQAGDDLGTTQENLTQVLQFASKNGFAPTIDNLAKMSDHLLAIKDPTERNAEAAKLFGRNWFEASQTILAGGVAIRAAADAQQGGLVVSASAAQATEDYRIQVDKLTDSWTNFKYQVGNAVIPVLNRALEVSVDTSTYAGIQQLAIENVARGVEAHAQALQAQGDAANKAKDALVQLDLSGLGPNIDLTGVGSSKADILRDSYLRQAQAAIDLKTAQEGVNGVLSQMGAAEAQLQDATQNLYNQLDSMAVNSADKAHQSMARTIEAYKIQDEAFGTHTALTAEKTQEVDKATQEFMNSPQAESDKQAYLKRLDDIKAKYAETDDSVEASKAKVKELQDQMDKLTGKTIEIIIKTYHEDIQGAPGGGPTKRPTNDNGPDAGGEAGANFIVPPGYPHDSFQMGLTSGEHVVVTNNYNLAISSNARTENLSSDFNMLKSLYSPGVT